MLCPKCKTDSAHRSHRSNLRERLASLAGYRPYRCHKCELRFSSIRIPPEEEPAPAKTSTTRVAMRWRRKRRDIFLYASALIVFSAILYLLTRPPSMGG
jgi:hypothetical protein